MHRVWPARAIQPHHPLVVDDRQDSPPATAGEHLERKDAFAEVYFDDRWDRMWLFVSLRNGDASEDVARWADPLEALSTA